MRDALVALHFQNDICHPHGKIPFSLDRDTGEATAFLEASRRALETARRAGWVIAHMHIAFAADYADLPRNAPLFDKVQALDALKRGSWGAAPLGGFEPTPGEIFVTGARNSAFRNTDLDLQLRRRAADRLNIIGLATQFAVEHTARDAVDMGYAVRVLADCCASGDRAAHQASLRTLGLLAEVVGSDKVLNT